MATKANLKDIGWMYHSPAQNASRDVHQVPPMSQIPGLGNAPEDCGDQDQNPKSLYRATDTPYIILSKQGGRRNLLQFSENAPKHEEAKGYPRCDWYYLEDNSLEEQQKRTESEEAHIFTLPDYMVDASNGRGPWEDAEGRQMRPPFALGTDRGMEGFDKMEGLPEYRPHGYGVRAEKQRKQTLRQRAEAEQARQRQKAQKPAHDPTVMCKLLSNSYHHELEQQQAKQALQEKRQREKMQSATEYMDMCEARKGAISRVASKGKPQSRNSTAKVKART